MASSMDAISKHLELDSKILPPTALVGLAGTLSFFMPAIQSSIVSDYLGYDARGC